MALAIGVRAAGERIAVGVVEGNRVVGPIRRYPEQEGRSDSLAEMPAEAYGDLMRREIEEVSAGAEIGVIGVGTPGIIRDGVIEESPNLQQLKGLNLGALLAAAFPSSSIMVSNDADVHLGQGPELGGSPRTVASPLTPRPPRTTLRGEITLGDRYVENVSGRRSMRRSARSLLPA